MGVALLVVLCAAEVSQPAPRTPSAIELAAISTVGTLPTAGPTRWGAAVGAMAKVDFGKDGFGVGADFEAGRLIGGGAYYLGAFHYGLRLGHLSFGQRVGVEVSPNLSARGAWVLGVSSGVLLEWAFEPRLLDAVGLPVSLVLGVYAGTEIWLVGRADGMFRGGLSLGVRL